MATYKKTFELTCTESKDGNIELRMDNHGFNGMELIAILETKKADLIDQVIHPANFKIIRETELEDGSMAKKIKEGEDEDS